MLNSTLNNYQGMEVVVDYATTKENFSLALNRSLKLWQEQQIKVVWVHLHKNNADLLRVILDYGFDFHHTNSDFIVLTKRLKDGALIPEFANHSIAIGGIVTDDNNQVLTIVEKAHVEKNPFHFKFPGGMVDRYEFFADAVKREIFEETGVYAEFKGIVGFRHFHKAQFGCSNIYFIAHLTALSTEINPCPEEIAKAQWMKTDEFLQRDSIIEFNKTMLRHALTGNYLHSTKIDSFLNLENSDYEIFI